MMENSEMSDFKSSAETIMLEINKRKLRSNFFEKLGYTPSLISQWRSGKRKPSYDQEKKFIQTAVDVIAEYHRDKSSSDKEKGELLKQFSNLTAA